MREQATADAETQAIEQQQRVCSEGAWRFKTVGTNKNKPIQITQDDDDGDTLAPTALDLPDDKWGGNEDNEDAPPNHKKNFSSQRNQLYVARSSKCVPTGIAYVRSKHIPTRATMENG